MELVIDLNELLRRKKAVVFDNLEDAIAFFYEVKIHCPERVSLWNGGKDLEEKYKSVHPHRFAVSFINGSMEYARERFYVEQGYVLIEFSSLISTEPILESDMLFSDLFKMV